MPSKYDRTVKHIKKSCKKTGKSTKTCSRIAHATATKRYGYKGKRLKR